MLNVNAITATLARMPDAALQKYAAMHKEDPYIMALAVSESNRRKQMRSAAQAPQGMPEPPKVADQAVAEMAPAAPPSLPEDQGIARLPTGNMSFAGGGIIAFADGDLVQDPDAARSRVNAAQQKLYTYGLRQRQQDPAGFQAAQAELSTAQAALDAIERQISGGPAGVLRQPIPAPPPVVRPAAPTPAPTAAPAPAAGAPVAPAPTVRAPDAGASRAAGPAVPAAPAAAAPNLDAASMMAAALKAAGDRPNQFAPDVEALGKERVAAKEAQAAGLKAIHEKFDDIYKGRRARLDTREAELGKTKDHHTGLALLQAGAAMMSTPGGLGRALGKGVAVGTEQYAAGMEKLQAAKDKLSDARDRLEEVEAQRGELSARELFKANNEIADAKLGAREDMIKSNMQMYGLNREEAMKVVDGQLRVGLEQFSQQQQNARNAADIAGRLKAAGIAAGPRENLMTEYTRFLKENPQYLSNEQAGMAAFLRARGALGMGATGGGTSVTDRPAGNLRPG